MSNKYFTVQEEYKERFYQLPKVFFTNEKYVKMRNETKIAYAILRDRLDLSIKNKWVDSTGKIYFIYTDVKLREILNCSKNHVTTIKKELQLAGLLEQKRQGLSKPNISYLMKPEITKNDVYKIQKEEDDLEVNSINDSHDKGIKNPTTRESRIPHQGNQESLQKGTNDTELSDTELSDTDNNLNNMYTGNSSNSNNPSGNAEDNNFNKEEHKKDMILNKYPQPITLIVKQLPYDDCKDVMDIIFKAKSSIIKELGKEYYKYGCDFTLEEHAIEIAETVQRVINEAKSNNSSIKNYHAYLTKSIKNYYNEYAHQMLKDQIERDMANATPFNIG